MAVFFKLQRYNIFQNLNVILFIIVYSIASIFPSVPLFLKPLGINIPELFLSFDDISDTFNFSVSILSNLIFTFFSISL